jgi:UTP--glucose-1-phosphate uridylyltransferase
MRSLNPKQLERLMPWGFDPDLLARWRQGVRSGELTKTSNVIAEPLLAPDPDAVHELPAADSPERAELEHLGIETIRRGEFGVAILNGGMATRFGGVVKGVVDVLPPHRSFLGLNMEDVHAAQRRCGVRIPVYVMNSFATDADTRAHFAERGWFGLDPAQVHFFTQFVSVRLTPGGELFERDDGDFSPYGPGHGDFAPAFRASGLLAQFLAAGGRHLFVSNVDNLGARIDPAILGHHVRSAKDVTVELAPKWPGDVGGSPFLVDGRVQLVEQIRYPKGFDPDIVDVFNTNTFHFRAEALDRDFDLNYYVVEKQVDGRPAVQFERLIGELTRHLQTNFVRVKRTGPQSRFLPVKTPDDLVAAREDIAAMYPGGRG